MGITFAAGRPCRGVSLLAMRGRICHACHMEVIGTSREKGTMYVAVLTLAVVGIALVLSTWQIWRRQQQAGLDHLELTAVAVLQAVDSSLRRGPMMGPARLPSITREFFRDLENSGDILFVGIIDENGVLQLTAGDSPHPALIFPPGALQEMSTANRWQGPAQYGQKPIFVAARRFHAMGPPRRGSHHRRDETLPTEQAQPGAFLMVAVDMDKHFAALREFRRTAVMQAAYTLGAAAFLWMLAVRFMSRRELAGKALYLERFQARLIDTLPDGLLIVDRDGKIQAANPTAHALFAEPGSPLAGKNMADLSLPFSLNPGDNWRHVSLDGKELEILGLPYRDEAETPSLMVILRDRTRLRTLERSLAEAEQLAAIGSLAAGVAHEIRNPLSALRGFAQYFAKKLAGKHPEEEYAQTMVRESDRLNRVVTDLLYLARPRDTMREPVDLERVADEMASLLQFELREQNLSLSRDMAAPAVDADPDALNQALLNLLLNSLEALAANGSDPPEQSRRLALSSCRGKMRGRQGVWVTVTDTGPGMSPENRAEAFKPFFTTKKKGTGLGLALVHAIMRAHDGETVIDSPLKNGEKGCAVSLFFPDPNEDTDRT